MLGVQVKYSIILIYCQTELCPLFHLCCWCTTDLGWINRCAKPLNLKTAKRVPLHRFPTLWLSAVSAVFSLCSYFLHVGIKRKFSAEGEPLHKAWLITNQKKKKGRRTNTKFKAALLTLIQNVLYALIRIYASPLKYREWTFWCASVVLPIAVNCRASTELWGKSLVCWFFCWWEDFAACQTEQSSQPTGVIRGGRSFDYDHYLVNKMSTRCFLDTLLSKRRKVQKWTPPSQWDL